MFWLVCLLVSALMVVPALAQSPAERDSVGLATSRIDSLGRIAQERTLDASRLKSEMRILGTGDIAGMRQWQREKSGRVAGWSSAVLPGLGQVYNGRKWKAVIMVGVFTYYMGKAWIEYKGAIHFRNARDASEENTSDWVNNDLLYQFHRENYRDYAWWTGAIWLIGVLDAWIDAHLFDVRSVDPAVIRGEKNVRYYGLSVGF